MLDFPRLIAGFVLSTAIGALAYRRQSLTRGGWLGAILTGTSTFGFGGWTWGLLLIAFFISSSLLSHFREARKKEIAGEKFEKSGRRDLFQTLANGGAGAVLALVYALLGAPLVILAAFAGVMATVTADTWATEVGVLSPRPPRSITTFRMVEPGTSGGISAYGLIASFGGALFIGLVGWALAAAEHRVWIGWLPLTALFGGLVGSLIDSLLGATVQATYRAPSGGETERAVGSDQTPRVLIRGWRWMNNDAVNFLSSLAGALAAVAVYSIVS